MKFHKTIGVIAVAAALMLSGMAFAGPLPKPNSSNPEAQKLIDKAWKLEKTGSSAELLPGLDFRIGNAISYTETTRFVYWTTTISNLEGP